VLTVEMFGLLGQFVFYSALGRAMGWACNVLASKLEAVDLIIDN